LQDCRFVESFTASTSSWGVSMTDIVTATATATTIAAATATTLAGAVFLGHGGRDVLQPMFLAANAPVVPLSVD
jgi:hypothetical protein